MDNPKSRGIKHLKNKTKYKPKGHRANSPPKLKSKTEPLGSNWDRYEDVPTENEQDFPTGSDYSLLANAPISRGSHFQFKADEDVNYCPRSQIQKSDLFDIDLNLLGISLSTIPFHERCNIPENYFTKSEIVIIESAARTNENAYQKLLSDKELKKNSFKMPENKFHVEDNPNCKRSESPNKRSALNLDKIQDLDEICALEGDLEKVFLTENPGKTQKLINESRGDASTSNHIEELEQWLEDKIF